MLTLDTVKKDLEGLDLIEAEYDGETIKLYHYKDFVKLALKMNAIVLYNTWEVHQDDIDSMRLEEEDLYGRFPQEYINKISKDITKYHQKIDEEEKFVDQIYRLELFLSSSSGVYSYTEVNSDTKSYDPEEFLQELMDRDEEFLEKLRHKAEATRREQFKVTEEAIIIKVLEDERFSTRKNKDLRRKYALELFREDEEHYESLGLVQYHLIDIIEEAWIRLKK